MNEIPDDLKRSLLEGRVLPFVGAGVSMAVKNVAGGSLFPDWKGLLAGAAAWLDAQREVEHAAELRNSLDASDVDLLRVAQEAQGALGSIWYEYLKSVLDPPHSRAHPDSLRLARAVWMLRSSLVVTTNFDKVLEWTCPEPLDVKSWSIEARVEKAQMIRRGLTHPAVWHLHGTIDEAENLILSTDGYDRLYPGDDIVPPSPPWKSSFSHARSSSSASACATPISFINSAVSPSCFPGRPRIMRCCTPVKRNG